MQYTELAIHHFYRTMHFSAKRGLAIACRPSICLSVGYPLLSQERVKLRTSNFACTFIGSIGTKAH